MNIPRGNLQNHVSQVQANVHKSAVSVASEFHHKVMAERCWEVDAFADKLERTPGADSQQITEASQARGTTRAKICAWAGAALAGAAVITPVVLGGPLSVGLMLGGTALLGGLTARHMAVTGEDDFQKSVQAFSQEVADGKAPSTKSGLGNGAGSAGQEWNLGPGNPASPLSPVSTLNPANPANPFHL